ncbi:hypothetical protein C923_02375 [Plasmodium falciparum UGT5.1]|uniref:Uncharacterized protein n=1 Tax=Plasmodium falciparum UGT5.1 TaxID=1237627 RepID=W7JPI2_PLAFA|nr:hypothetical protein C923_02375 [Plasmodium falciparum UGT5.1]
MVQNLCFHYLRSLGTVLLVKKRHPIYRGNETGNSGGGISLFGHFSKIGT